MTAIETGLRDLIAELVAKEVDRRLADVAAGWANLTVKAAARYASVSPATIRRWYAEGRLPAVGAGKMMRVHRVSLDKLLAEGGTSRRRTSTRKASPEQLADLADGGGQ